MGRTPRNHTHLGPTLTVGPRHTSSGSTRGPRYTTLVPPTILVLVPSGNTSGYDNGTSTSTRAVTEVKQRHFGKSRNVSKTGFACRDIKLSIIVRSCGLAPQTPPRLRTRFPHGGAVAQVANLVSSRWSACTRTQPAASTSPCLQLMLWLVKDEVCGLERASARPPRRPPVATVQFGPLDNILAGGTERNAIPAEEWRRQGWPRLPRN